MMGIVMRHSDWNKAIELLGKIGSQFGNSFHDSRCGKIWDVGQAVCAEAYGADWMNNEKFIEMNRRNDDLPPESHYMECIEKMADGYLPNWAKIE